LLDCVHCANDRLFIGALERAGKSHQIGLFGTDSSAAWVSPDSVWVAPR
jgi:hypothetical protein